MSVPRLILLLLFIQYSKSVSVEYIPQTRTPPSSRKQAGLTINPNGDKLYIYGGKSEYRFSDMWEFDLITKTWSEMHPVSILKPGPRSNAFITSFRDQRKIVLFGGDTSNGPISDIWLFDIENQSVMIM